MSRADGVLRVVLTCKWFDMIERGEKLEEYRAEYWDFRLMSREAIAAAAEATRTNPDAFRPSEVMYFDDFNGPLFHPYHTLVASRGYTSQTLTRKIGQIRWGLPRPEWSGDTVSGPCFIIELEPKHHGP